MVKKNQKSDEIAKIKKALEEKKVIMGTERTIKELKKGKVVSVFVTNNCEKEISEDLKRYAELQKKEFVELSISNEELGVVCKKPFSISVIGISE